MTNRDIMLSALKKHTIPLLLERGFIGKHPHYKRVCEDHIELISFQTNKGGGSFTIEVSAVFPGKENNNCCMPDSLTEIDLTVAYTDKRYRLPGMFDGWFYYSDVYKQRFSRLGVVYNSLSEKEAEHFTAPKGCKLVQKFNNETAVDICSEINRQLKKAYIWLNKFKKVVKK